MRSRSRYLGSLLVVAALAVGCGGQTVEQVEEDDPPAEATGVVTSVEPSDGEVQSFVVDDETEGSVEIRIADDVEYGFDLEHLREHMETGDPVTVDIEDRDGEAYALSIEDV